MVDNKPAINMPELLVFTKPLISGFVLAEVWRLAFYLGGNFAPSLSRINPWLVAIGILLVAAELLSNLVYDHQAASLPD